MYQAYWGLSHSPFAPAAIRQLLDSQPQCGEALARLDFLVEHKSRFGLLTGPAGSGKSLILGEFVRRQREVGAAAAAVRATGLSASDLLAEVAAVWGCDPAASATSAVIWRRVADRLAEFRLEQVPAVLALDDLDQAASDARHAIQRLLQLPDVDLTVVAAASDDGLSGLGRLVDHADLRVELACWSVDDTRNYLSASLASAGRQQTVFAERAVQRLFQLSGGLPRRVGQLAQLALIAGAGQSQTQIDEQTVLAVHDELSAAR